MSEKITVNNPLVVLHGDEMAQIAFEQILRQFVTSKLDIELVEIDLTADCRHPKGIAIVANPAHCAIKQVTRSCH